MKIIKLQEVFFGAPVVDPDPKARPQTKFHERNKYDIYYMPELQSVCVKKDGFEGIYPFTNVKMYKIHGSKQHEGHLLDLNKVTRLEEEQPKRRGRPPKSEQD